MNKKIFSIWSVLLILIVSIAVVVPGCDGGATTYNLAMAENPAECGTATDLTGASSYAANATVNIKAVADPCCRFVDWTAPDGTFGNSTAAETTFIMPARDVTVTANFELTPLDHFKTYWADWPLEPPPQWEPPLPVDVQLEDQFVTINATVWEPYLFANPVEKWKMVGKEEVRTPIWDPKDHLTLYYIDSWADPQEWDVEVTNQFGINQVLRVAGPFYLAVPTGKLTPDWPTDVNHYLVYDVYYKEYPMEDICIWDQFIEGETTVYEPYLFAVPAQKTHPPGGPVTPIVGDDHLLFYWIDGIHPLNKYNLPVVNQFGEQYLDVFEDEYNFLGVPSQKVSVEGPYPYEPPF